MRSLSRVIKSGFALTDGGNSAAEVWERAGEGNGLFSSWLLEEAS